MKNTILTFKKAKEIGQKLTMLTAYDYTTAKIIDDSGVNAILVGDSLGMVMLGYEDTLKVTIEDMIHHTAAVARAAKNALVIGDMPFMSYSTGVRDSVINAGRLVKEGGAHCVKLEGGQEICDVIKEIVAAKIPVCAHLGLTPQAVNTLGGFNVQGKDEASARKLFTDALAVQDAGAFALVLECIPDVLAKKISDRLDIPTIGIGAGVHCDGQVLVYQDMLGLYDDFTPRFVKQFATAGDEMRKGITAYIKAVQERKFPEPKHTFTINEALIEKLY